MPYTRLFYHCIWSTKQRLPLIQNANRKAIYDAIASKAKKLDATIYAINGMPDHVHIVVTVPPSVALATFIGQIKGVSSYHASRLKGRDGFVPFEWQAEYGILSISERDLPKIIRYVEMQQIHHAKSSVIPSLESARP